MITTLFIAAIILVAMLVRKAVIEFNKADLTGFWCVLAFAALLPAISDAAPCRLHLHRRQPTQVMDRQDPSPRERSILRSDPGAPARNSTPAAHPTTCKCGCKDCTGKPGCPCKCKDCRCNEKRAGVDLSDTESRMVAEINRYRSRFNKGPLSPHPLLERLARDRVHQFNHQANGKWSWEQAHAWGFRGDVTDNLSQGQFYSPEDCVQGWGRCTDGHEMQMRGYFKMNGRFQDYHFDSVGVAHSGQNWIAIFGRDDASHANASMKHVELVAAYHPQPSAKLDAETWRDFDSYWGEFCWLRLFFPVGA